MSGERYCKFNLFYKMNYFTPKVDADLGDWVERHTRLIKNILEEYESSGGTIKIESENYFNVKSKSGVMIGGQCDIVIGEDTQFSNDGLVIDAKTGKQRGKDRSQVMLYMALLPHVKDCTQITKTPFGEVRYSHGSAHEIKPEEINDQFKLDLSKLLKIATSDLPEPSPSVFECKYCDLYDICPHKITELDEASEVDWL